MIKYTVYKTTNLINGKIYIGVHKQTRSKDWYIGSGKAFKSALKKYGRESFSKEVLFEYSNPKEAYDKEAELVNSDFVSDPDTYNLVPGGIGGPGKKLSDSHIKIIIETKTGIPRTQEAKDKMSRKIPSPNKGKILSPSHKDALSKAKLKKILVDDIIYSSSSEVAEEYGIALSTVRARIYSKKWDNWKYYDNDSHAS
ncbi:homing endonuclease [Serratia phage vB_SspM_LC53]|nr:homing endonuclease [Serratia phage vB_SspM_LC53]